MRRRQREINIFNLSMLDVIAGAMGAFLIVMVILLPFYRKQAPSSPAAATEAMQAQLADARARAARAESAAQAAQAEAANRAAELAEQQGRNAALRQELKKTFLLIHIHWPTLGVDLDLHVVDPAGHEFYWERRSLAGASGNLSVDSLIGPGNEVFTDGAAAPGDYRVYVHFFNTHAGMAESAVDGAVLFREGTLRLPGLTLRMGQPKQLMAVLRLDAEGRVGLVPP